MGNYRKKYYYDNHPNADEVCAKRLYEIFFQGKHLPESRGVQYKKAFNESYKILN